MNRSWAEYKVGFGERSGNYWFGNDLLSQLTANNRYKLRFDLQQNGSGTWYYAEYSTFRVGLLSEADNYTLQVGGFSGNAYDSFRYHNGLKFTTFDSDNDAAIRKLCSGARRRILAPLLQLVECERCEQQWSLLLVWSAWRSRPAAESDVAAV